MSHQHYILWQIECNEIPILEITKEVEDVFIGSDVRYDDITILLKALVMNQSIRTIRFEGDFLDCLQEERRSEVIRVVGSYLPSLHEICLGDSPIFVTDLCHLITKSKALRVLNLHDLVLQGQPEDFHALETALLQHPSIKEFEMNECNSAIPGIDLDNISIKNAGQRRNRLQTNVVHNLMLPPLSPLLAKKRLSVAKSA